MPLEYTSCTAYKNDSQRSYRPLATLAGYLIVLLTLITTARRSPLERFGLNASCMEASLHGQLLDAAGADRGYNIATSHAVMENFCHRPRHQSHATSV